MDRKMKIAFFSVFLVVISGGAFADHTVVNNLQCTRDSGVITTSWMVLDSTEKYGGDLVIEADFDAQCSDEVKPGKVSLELHLSQDTAEIYSYLCNGSTTGVSVCTATAKEKEVEGAVMEAVGSAAEALCELANQSLVSVTDGNMKTDVRVRHLQRGEKITTHCHDG